MGETTHAEVHFQGRVQGVGFRYAVSEVAREYEVAGYVQNLADGRVRVEAEGTQAELDRFIAAIEARMPGYIRKVEKSFRARTGHFAGFSIR
jgi:acylphosphatase